MLSLQQYEILGEKRSAIESFANTGNAGSLDLSWLRRMSDVHRQIFNSPPVDIGCKKCIGIALGKLWYQMGLYEAEQARLKEELENKIAAEPPLKKQGKDWTKK